MDGYRKRKKKSSSSSTRKIRKQAKYSEDSYILTSAQMQRIIEIFQHMAKYHFTLGDHIREKAYLFAVAALTERQAKNDTKLDTIYATENIGKKMRAKIEAILETGSFLQYDEMRDNKELNAMLELQTVFGVGPALARNLVKRNIFSVEELKHNLNKVPAAVRLGLKYYDQLHETVPTHAIQTVVDSMQTAACHAGGSDYQVILCGSARRGKTPRDLDILLVSTRGNGLSETIENFFADSNFRHVGTFAKGKSKQMFLVEFTGRVFKVDVKSYPRASRAAAELYFTGPKLFNIWLRSRALKLGYSLKNDGLYKGRSKCMVKLETESDIFDILQVQYLTPAQRSEFWMYV